MLKLKGLVCLLLMAANFVVPSKSTPRINAPSSRLPVTMATTAQSSGLNFAAPVVYSSGGDDTDSISVADLNGDGQSDLIVVNPCADKTCETNGSIGILLGKSDGTFSIPTIYDSGGIEASSLAVADVNQDGKLDILIANAALSGRGHGTVGVLLGNGDGTFQTVETYDSGAFLTRSVAVADVNGDGRLDLLTANGCTAINIKGCDGEGAIGVLLGNGDGTFQAGLTYDAGGQGSFYLTVSDINGDGKLDVIALTQCPGGTCHSLSVIFGNGDGSFQTPITYATGGDTPLAVVPVDINGDGYPDLIVANECASRHNCPNGVIGVLFGTSNGTFRLGGSYNSGGPASDSVVVADIDGDGKLDLLVTNSCASSCVDSVSILLGNGDGTFQAAVSFNSGGINARSIAVVDLNGDGKPDLVMANNESSGEPNGIASVLLNTSRFPTTVALSSSTNPSAFGETVTFTASIVQQFGAGIPTGTVSFFDGTTALGSSSVNSSGVAIFPTSTLTVGTHSITAAYSGDVTFAPSTATVLSQVVQGAIATLSTASLNFGNQTGNIASSPQTVTLTNTGNISLTPTISITGTGTGTVDFAQTSNCGTSVAAGASCTISVTFTPTALGAISGAVSITDNAANSPQTVSLAGVGVLPMVAFSPPSLTFPTQLVFTSSQAQTGTLTNTGLGVLNITKVSAKGQFSETNTCGATVAPGGNCTISVTFKPTAKGPIKSSIFIADNAPGNVSSFALTGTGTYVQVSPTTVNFGTQPVGTKSLSKRITLTNKGDGAINFTSISITGTNKSDFSQTNNCGASLATGGSCFLKVIFTPSATGKRIGGVSIVDDGGGSPQNVSLAGTGTP